MGTGHTNSFTYQYVHFLRFKPLTEASLCYSTSFIIFLSKIYPQRRDWRMSWWQFLRYNEHWNVPLTSGPRLCDSSWNDQHEKENEVDKRLSLISFLWWNASVKANNETKNVIFKTLGIIVRSCGLKMCWSFRGVSRCLSCILSYVLFLIPPQVLWKMEM